MSFYTSLLWYRPTPPPRVSTLELATAIERLLSCPALEGQGSFGANVKFGTAIDLDERPTFWEEPAQESGVVWESQEIDWDVQTKSREIAPVLQSLRSADEPVYRARVQLGRASDAACNDVRRLSCPKNKRALTLDSWPSGRWNCTH